MMTVLANCAAGFCATATGIHLASAAIAARRCRPRDAPIPAPSPSPCVTVLRPVCGLESYSAATLGSSFVLNYPRYEVIFCVADGGDPVVPVVRRLIADNPAVSARLLVGDARPSVNPKLNNLIKGWAAASHTLVVMIDSNVLLAPDTLQQLLVRWRPGTGAVCSMPIGSQPGNFWAELECAFLNTHQARFQYVSETVGFGFAQGKTMLFRRDVIERAGGVLALASDPAEDAAATKLVRRAGLRVRLVDRPFEQPLGRRRATEVWARQLRWARLRRNSFAWLFLPEILVGSGPPSLALAIAAAHYGVSIAAAVAPFLLSWFAAEAFLSRRTGWHFSWRMPAAMLLRDLLLPLLAIAAWTGSEFVWRGNAMSVPRLGTHRRAALSDLPA